MLPQIRNSFYRNIPSIGVICPCFFFSAVLDSLLTSCHLLFKTEQSCLFFFFFFQFHYVWYLHRVQGFFFSGRADSNMLTLTGREFGEMRYKSFYKPCLDTNIYRMISVLILLQWNLQWQAWNSKKILSSFCSYPLKPNLKLNLSMESGYGAD